jgi:hypothetical protein
VRETLLLNNLTRSKGFYSKYFCKKDEKESHGRKMEMILRFIFIEVGGAA